MPTYLFQLGHQPHISTAEIQAVFSQLKIKFIITQKTKEYLILESKEKIVVDEIINILGGTIKISQQILKTDNIINDLAEYINKKQPDGKIQFSLSGVKARDRALKIKKQLKSFGRSVRYIEPKNTATILYNKLIEKQSDFTIIDNKIFVTEAIQHFEDFSQRDFGRPAFDDKSGMLPPKLARIMVNLAQTEKQEIILDPFCGSGTVMMEAATLGHVNLIGSDISHQAILDTQRNLDWTIQHHHLPPLNYQTFKKDVKEINTVIKNKVGVIITEPYLGRPLKGSETSQELSAQAQDLKQLYLEAFKTFHKILATKGVIIFIIPKFRYKDSWIEIDCLNEIKKIGFKPIPFDKENKSLLYWRQGQHLGREIWRFGKIK